MEKYLKYFDLKRVLLLFLANACLFAYIYAFFNRNAYYGITAIYPEASLDFYYSIHDTTQILYLFVLNLFLSPNIISADIFKERKGKFCYLIKTRISARKYYISGIISNFLITFFYYVIFEILLILFIHFFLAPISFDFIVDKDFTSITHTETFAQNHVLNLLIFIFLTSAGYALFSSFIFSLKSYIKNIYVYRSIGFIIGLVLAVLPVILGATFFESFSNEGILHLFSTVYITNIIAPGITHFGKFDLGVTAYHAYFITFLIYFIFTMFMLKFSDKEEYING